MILKQVIHYTDTNSVEATWIDANGDQVKCHSYSDVQMDMLQADLGADAPAYADLIATVKANIVTPAPPTQAEINADILSQIDALERAAMMPRGTREYMIAGLEAKAIALGAAMTPPLDATASLTAAYSGNILYRKAKDLDAAIVALRSQIV